MTSKHRYITLDGMRGVAAVLVILFHSGRFYGAWVPRFGYLAVDLFFLLSGFVLTHSYSRRLNSGMTAIDFFKARIVRLYPLYFIGLLLGTSVALAGLNNPNIPAQSYRDIAVNFCFNLFVLPAPPSFTDSKQDLLFVINFPFWSLFFEFWIANVVFAFLQPQLNRTVLAAIIGCSAIGLIASEKVSYTLSWGAGWQTIGTGFARIGFSFFCGVVVAEFYGKRRPAIELPSWIFLVALLLLLSLPLDGKVAHLYELICVTAVFPALIYLGASASETNQRLSTTVGDGSYAAYTIHGPLWVAASWTIAKLTIHPSWELQAVFLIVVCGLAWTFNLLDLQIRVKLTRMIKTRDVKFDEGRIVGVPGE